MKSPGAAAFLQFGPDFPDPKPFRLHAYVVHEQDSARADFRQPRLEIVPHGFFGVKAVEMKNVDAPRRKCFTRIVKARADEGRERFVILSIVRGNLCKRRLIIATRMLIALPRIDPKASGAGLIFHRRLAKGEVAFPPIHAQLDEQAWFQRRDQVVGKGDVVGPSPDSIDAGREIARR